MTRSDEVVQQLVSQNRRSQDAWINGQIDEGIFARDAAVTLMNPFGGYSRPGYSSVRPHQERAISHFESGTDASIEVVQAIVAVTCATLRPADAAGILAPVSGLALGALWAARHGKFPRR